MAPSRFPFAAGYANHLLAKLGAPPIPVPAQEPHPAVRWAESGAMALTGEAGADPVMCPVPLASCADGVLAALRAQAPDSPLAEIDGAQLLGERAALAGLKRSGGVAPGAQCRLLPTRDGHIAVNLARPSDWDLLPAWLEAGELSDWDAVAAVLAGVGSRRCIERGRLLGLAVAPMEPQAAPAPWIRAPHRSTASPMVRSHAPLVVDLASLWAGPLCTHLLQLMGARVIKIESTGRPDGMRAGNDGFFDLLNAGKASVALELQDPAARAQLRALLLRADIIVEASRPRALRQLGIRAEEILAANPHATWIGISGYGREEPAANWIAYGDDAAVAGGLSQVLWECTGDAIFCGDAIADPLTGLHAALAAWVSFSQGGGQLLSLSLSGVVANGIGFASPGPQGWRARAQEWSGIAPAAAVLAPRARAVRQRAPPLGADTVQLAALLRST